MKVDLKAPLFMATLLLALCTACGVKTTQTSGLQAAESIDAGAAVWEARSVWVIEAMRDITQIGAGLSYSGPRAPVLEDQLKAYKTAFDENQAIIPLFWIRPILVLAPNYFDWKAQNHDKFAALGDIRTPAMVAYEQLVAKANADLAALTDDTQRTTARLKQIETLCKELYQIYITEASVTKYNDHTFPVPVIFVPGNAYALSRAGDQTLPNGYYEMANYAYLKLLSTYLTAVEAVPAA